MFLNTYRLFDTLYDTRNTSKMSHISCFNDPTGQGDELTPEKGDDTSLEYLDYEEEEDEVVEEVSDVFSVQDVEDNSANPSAQGDETEYFGNSVNACPGRVINTDLSLVGRGL